MTDPSTQPLLPGAPPALSAWIALFTGLDRDGVPSAGHLAAIATDDVRFRDPFNDLRGIEGLRRLLAHTREQLPEARLEVLDSAWSAPTAYLKWRMTARIRVIGDWQVEGMSEVRFAPDGRVAYHLDHWDAAAQFYGRLPLIGPLLCWLGRSARVV
jgi:steroid Delta-isomerase